MNGKKYESPYVEIKFTSEEDVIRTSGGDNDLVWDVDSLGD